jgi:hypothetical protein
MTKNGESSLMLMVQTLGGPESQKWQKRHVLVIGSVLATPLSFQL